jgi:hypothetical protein
VIDRVPLGPPGLPVIGNLLELRGDPLGFFTRCARAGCLQGAIRGDNDTRTGASR